VASDGTSLIPDGGGAGLILPEDTYTFAAYSYNSTAVAPDYSYPVTDVTVSPEYDLLWGDAKNEDITGGGDVEITMYHKLSQVLVSVTSTAITPAVMVGGLTNFSIIPCYKAYLTVADGTIENEGTEMIPSHTPSSWNGSGTQTASSATGCIVYTAGEHPLSVTIGSVTLGTMTYPNAPAKFDMPLELGKSYTLAVSFKRNLVWAGSNVYWRAASGGQAPGYLTFDAPGSGDGSQKKQGVFFKWGSLVGMSPAGTEYSTLFDIARPVYTPTFTSPTVKSWSDVNPYTAWEDIPFVEDWVIGDRFDTYLMDDARNTGNTYAYWKEKRGDICRYISENGYGPGGNYRMPTNYEQGAAVDFSYESYNTWGKYPASTWVNLWGTTTADGQTEMPVYVYLRAGTHIFPISGVRRGDGGRNGRLYGIGIVGYYWSGSPMWGFGTPNQGFDWAVKYARLWAFINDKPGYTNSQRGEYAFSIRCVQNN
jgi:hypothetical protein